MQSSNHYFYPNHSRMKIFRFLLFAFITLALVVLLNKRIVIKETALPPLGKFLSPFTGFWQNAEPKKGNLHFAENISGLQEAITVQLDEQRVPHIFAKNEHDLYFAQGYLTARDRLWQMEFMILGASGRISELVGDKALKYDRTTRRIGLPYAAKKAIEHLETDTVASTILNSYAEGVNAYINSLDYKDLSLEYKLLDYAPEEWIPYNSALLLKYMSNMLTGREYDFEYTNALKFLDRPTFELLFADFPKGIDPIIPVGTPFTKSLAADSSSKVQSFSTHQPFIPSPFEKPEANLGSNNWAVSPAKSATGKALLCNDPHLALHLPSIWYQLQMNAPGVNAYGVTIPGAPGITIGFNENIAWGVTNGSMDVKDWYRIEFKDASQNEYRYDGKYLPTKKIVEEIKIRNGETYYDTIVYTHHGPVTYDAQFKFYDNPYPVALRWTAHDASNELKTFYLLNRAKNYDDYINALNYYECPGQNFVFASVSGDIAIKEQGKFILRKPDEGKFIQDGTTSATEWRGFIPFADNPQVKNPERGFVSSANQHPTDTTYPYYYHGLYEYYRNRRINNVLSSKEKFSAEDLMKLQNDNSNLMASEVLPYLLTKINPASLSEIEKKTFSDLAAWNFYNEKDLTAPTYFTLWWDKFYELLWDEFLPEEKKGLTAPDFYNTVNYIITAPDNVLTDNQQTPEKETLSDLLTQSFKQSVTYLDKWSDSTKLTLEWATYKGTRLAHWLPIEPFYVKNLAIGGNYHIVNATSKTHGGSWRMVVELGGEAYGIYPGGQSGNPGSPFYSNFTDKWVKGEYNTLVFLKNESETNENILLTKTITPAK